MQGVLSFVGELAIDQCLAYTPPGSTCALTVPTSAVILAAATAGARWMRQKPFVPSKDHISKANKFHEPVHPLDRENKDNE